MDLTVDESMTSGYRPCPGRGGPRRRPGQQRRVRLVRVPGGGPLSEARHQFEVNVFGPARLTQLVLPGMRAQRVRAHHQHFLNRRQDLRASGGLVPRHQVRPGGPERFPAGRTGAVRDRCRGHRAGRHPLGVGGDRRRQPAGALGRRSLCTASRRHGQSARRVRVAGQGLSPPEAVARVVVAAANARRPKTRYPVGRGARAILLARRPFPTGASTGPCRCSTGCPLAPAVGMVAADPGATGTFAGRAVRDRGAE